MSVTQAERDAGPGSPAEQTSDAGAGGGLSAPPRHAGRESAFRVAVWGPPLAVLVVFVGVWLLLSYVVLDPDRRFLLPPPQKVIEKGFLTWTNLSEILLATWATAKVALTGLGIAIVAGMTFAVAMSQARWVERSLYPYAVVLQTIPILALVPLIGFWFGFNFGSRVFVCVLIAVFPIITNTLFGLKSVDRGLSDLFRLHGAGRLTRLRKLQLPSALPAIFTGLRISAGLSVIGAIVGEFFFRQGFVGIGRLLDLYRSRLLSEQLFTAIFFSALLGLAMFWLFGFIAHRVLRDWHESAR